jgi:hypothetical protein
VHALRGRAPRPGRAHLAGAPPGARRAAPAPDVWLGSGGRPPPHEPPRRSPPPLGGGAEHVPARSFPPATGSSHASWYCRPPDPQRGRHSGWRAPAPAQAAQRASGGAERVGRRRADRTRGARVGALMGRAARRCARCRWTRGCRSRSPSWRARATRSPTRTARRAWTPRSSRPRPRPSWRASSAARCAPFRAAADIWPQFFCGAAHLSDEGAGHTKQSHRRLTPHMFCPGMQQDASAALHA